MKKFLAGLTIAALFAVPLPVSNASAAPYCGITWGSNTKNNNASNYHTHITDARTGQHSCYDRIVFDLDGSAVGYNVSYVSNISTEGEGTNVPLTGGAKL